MDKKKIFRKVVTGMLVASLILPLTGCGGNKTQSGSQENRKDPSEIVRENQGNSLGKQDKEEKVGKKKTEYPLTITTYGSDGKELKTTYQKAPEKVLAVYQGSIETLLALGLEKRIVAAAGLDNEVPAQEKSAFSTVKYLDEFTPSLETVTMLEPDMIFSWGSLFGEKTLGDAAAWVKKGCNVYINSNTRPKSGEVAYPRTLENEFRDILNIGKIFDVQDEAEAMVNQMKSTIEQVKKETAEKKDKPKVLILESQKGGFTNYGEMTLGGDMVTQLGGILVNSKGSTLGKEDVLGANPDVIFVVYMPYAGDNPEEVKQKNLDVILKDETLRSLDAVKKGRVIPIMLSEMYASATRTQDGISTFAEGLYPDLQLD